MLKQIGGEFLRTKKIWILNILLMIVLASTIQVVGSQNNDSTTLEIIDIQGGLFGVTAFIKNTGSVEAESFRITLSVKGGLLNKIDVFQDCSGCGNCGTTIPIGEIKIESTKESGNIIGFGQVDIIVTAEADNADLVTREVTGFVLGPYIIIS